MTNLIPTKERLIFALDTNDLDKAKKIVSELDDSVFFYKIGLELLTTGNYFQLLDWLISKDKKIFIDLKLFDIPETIAKTVANLNNSGASFLTVHGNEKMLAAAIDNKKDLKILAVTALTSLDEGDLKDIGFLCDVKTLVLSRAKRAFKLGCDGVITSGLEVSELRKNISNKLIVVTPGIRPVKNDDDQKRTIDVKKALDIGVDYLVIGRPISQAEKPYKAALHIQEIIANHYSSRVTQR